MIDILSVIGRPAALEQLAEESSGLAQAALKLARYLRAENPTPKSRKQCEEDLKEEVTDVILAMEALGLQADPKIRDQKRQRWIGRRMAEDAGADPEGSGAETGTAGEERAD